MKIKKRVVDGEIEVKIEDLPQYPNGTRFEGKRSSTGFMLADQDYMNDLDSWSRTQTIIIGDFHYLLKDKLQQLNILSSVEEIATEIESLHEEVMKAYARFQNANTESIETLSRTQVIDTLLSEDRLCYRDKAGKFQPLNI
ncbi:MAG TPA: hypothetical protein ENH07_10320 [Nitrospirae bacterium]|nr:hypothetical protein [Nitrospirota bacterium]